MPASMQNPAAEARANDNLPLEVLLGIGESLLSGVAWESALSDPRWSQRILYIAYTHDRLGTPDRVEGVCFERREAEALATLADQRFTASHSQHQHYYKFRIIEWPLATLAIREARDGFHLDVARQFVGKIKNALRDLPALPKNVVEVRIGASENPHEAANAYIAARGERIVLWEDCCCLPEAGLTIEFATRDKPVRYGLMNHCGDILVPPAFDQIGPLCEGLAVARRDGKVGYVDAHGATFVPFIYEDAADCSGDLLLVKSGGLWGAIGRGGRQVIAPRYEHLEHDAANAGLRAIREGKHGYLSLEGKLLVGYSDYPLLLAERSFASERAVFIAYDTSVEPASQILVDALGRRIGPHGFATIRYGYSGEGLMCAKKLGGDDGRFGYINLHGDAVIPFHFAQAENFCEGVAAVSLEAGPGARFGYIDRNGDWIIAPHFQSAGEFRQGLAPARGPYRHRWMLPRFGDRASHRSPDARYGFIDRKGHWAIAPQFADVKPFSEGMAAVRMDKDWGYIDINGKLAVAGQYQEAGPFKQGAARVARRFDGPLRWGLIDNCGRPIIPLRFDWLSYPQGGLITACDEFGMWGCFTLFGNIALPFNYRDARDLQMALAARSA